MNKFPVLLTWSTKKTSEEVCELFKITGVVAAEEYEKCLAEKNQTDTTKSESYGPKWTEVRLMIHEDGTINCVGGEREPGTGDTAYKGVSLLEKYWKIKLGYSPKM